MKRNLYTELVGWKDSDTRKTLLVRGARQVGKTFVVNMFGKNEFKNHIELNFERNPEYAEIFSTRVPSEIVERILLFTGQEIIANGEPHTKSELFYWGRKAKNSTAEIDYLLEKYGKIIPVEVKSGSTGRMKGMHMFNEQFKIQKALKISQAPFAEGKPIVSLPFYGIESFMAST